LGLFVSACASIDVKTEYDPDVSFDGLTTFAWLPDPPPDMSTNRPTVRRIVRQAVEGELQALGYTLDPFGNPDFWINAHVLSGRTDVRSTWDFYGYGGGYWISMWAAQRNTSFFQEGTLLLDMLDRDRRVKWRGIATGAVESGQRAAADAERVVTLAVAKMLEGFPP
ncbi:MAG: DUF4136 domain-containing protein, partial [Gemmatimonadota bacterium]